MNLASDSRTQATFRLSVGSMLVASTFSHAASNAEPKTRVVDRIIRPMPAFMPEAHKAVDYSFGVLESRTAQILLSRTAPVRGMPAGVWF